MSLGVAYRRLSLSSLRAEHVKDACVAGLAAGSLLHDAATLSKALCALDSALVCAALAGAVRVGETPPPNAVVLSARRDTALLRPLPIGVSLGRGEMTAALQDAFVGQEDRARFALGALWGAPARAATKPILLAVRSTALLRRSLVDEAVADARAAVAHADERSAPLCHAALANALATATGKCTGPHSVVQMDGLQVALPLAAAMAAWSANALVHDTGLLARLMPGLSPLHASILLRGGRSALRARLAAEADARAPPFLRRCPKYTAYFGWMDARLRSICPTLTEGEAERLLTMDAANLDLLISAGAPLTQLLDAADHGINFEQHKALTAAGGSPAVGLLT